MPYSGRGRPTRRGISIFKWTMHRVLEVYRYHILPILPIPDTWHKVSADTDSDARYLIAHSTPQMTTHSSSVRQPPQCPQPRWAINASTPVLHCTHFQYSHSLEKCSSKLYLRGHSSNAQYFGRELQQAVFNPQHNCSELKREKYKFKM